MGRESEGGRKGGKEGGEGGREGGREGEKIEALAGESEGLEEGKMEWEV